MSDKPIIRAIITHENNFVKRQRVYKNGILVYEAFFKNFYCINRANIKTYVSPYNLDSTQSIYYSNGNLKHVYTWKNYKKIKQISYDKSGNITQAWPKK